MSEATASRVVRIERVLAAPPERVFAAWTDPASLARWLSPVGHAEVAVEPWVGGQLRVTMIGPGVRIEHTGEYRELVPGRRLVFTWRSPFTGPGPSLVTIELEPTGAGTALTLVHEHLSADAVDSHGGGWSQILDRLAAELAAATRAGGS
jgi:uncharacterized protein YndB with AHSA1/START domain